MEDHSESKRWDKHILKMQEIKQHFFGVMNKRAELLHIQK